MAYIFFNPNPKNNRVGDCTVRALSKLLNQDWNETYLGLCLQGFLLKDMPSSNDIWSRYLIEKGFTRGILPDTCPSCYTIRQFCTDNPKGSFLLATGTHVVAVIDGNYYDSWDSGNEVPIYFFKRKE